MKITDVKVLPLNNIEGSKLVAIASIVLDDEFAIHGIRIINGNKGLFISMPSKRNSDGTYADIVHPINSTAREIIQNYILDEYNRI